MEAALSKQRAETDELAKQAAEKSQSHQQKEAETRF